MDKSTLERLMIDDSLGALSPDAQALLEAYLREHGDGIKELERWRCTADSARAAMRWEQMEFLPLLRKPPIVFPFPKRSLAAAAMLLIGIGIGRRISPVPQPTIQTSPLVEAPQTAATSGVADFWSPQRFLDSALNSERHAESEPNWKGSFTELSKSGGKL